jgi:hypothetical protein
MKKKLFLFTAILIFAVNYSQTTTETVPTTSNKIRVYTPSASNSANGKQNDNSYKWVAKTDFIAVLTGEFPLIAEVRIGKKFSVEGSVAVTNAFLPNDLILTDDSGSDYNSKAAIGTAFRGTLKFYPSSDYDAIEGWSFGIQLFTKTTNREYEVNSTFPELEGKIDTKTKTGISLIISKQIFADSNIAFESFIGVGMANITREYYNTIYNSATGFEELNQNNTSESTPNFQFGFRIGFGN